VSFTVPLADVAGPPVGLPPDEEVEPEAPLDDAEPEEEPPEEVPEEVCSPSSVGTLQPITVAPSAVEPSSTATRATR